MIRGVCAECQRCYNYKVCENGCFGSDKPCEYYITESKEHTEYLCDDCLYAATCDHKAVKK